MLVGSVKVTGFRIEDFYTCPFAKRSFARPGWGGHKWFNIYATVGPTRRIYRRKKIPDMNVYNFGSKLNPHVPSIHI